MRYYVKHETSHVQYSDFGVLNKYKPVGLLALINNLIEDHRIDYVNDSQYMGDAITSNNYWVLYTDDIVKRIVSTDTELAEQQRVVLPLFVWDAALRTWITNASETRDVMANMQDDDGIDKLHKLEKYTDELLVLRADTALDVGERVYDLAVRILADLFDGKAEDYSDEGDEKGEGGSGKGKGKGDKGGDDSGDSEGTGGSDEDKLVNVEKLIKAIGHEHKPSRTGIHLVMSGADLDGAYTIPHKDEYVIIHFPELHRVVRGHTGYMKDDRVSKYITSNSKPLANQLRMRLQTRSRDRYEYGLKRGKLHTGSLHKLLSGDTDASTRVFRKRIVSDTLDTAVTLLVDCSGSMSGNKFEMACSGAGAMAEALKPLNIAFNVLGFTNVEGNDEPMIWVFNDFGERVSTPELVSRFKTASGCLWENTDGDALAYAAYVLSLRREKRKVLLVLSDGSPAGRDSHGDITAYTARVVKDIEASGVDVYGIGILDDNVRHFYKKHEVVNNVDNLSSTILSVLDRSI
jgi:cobalamin biosynthesis protein CobT